LMEITTPLSYIHRITKEQTQKRFWVVFDGSCNTFSVYNPNI